MFEGPEYESYIALCRELRLERKIVAGDWYWHPGTDLGPFIHCWCAKDAWANVGVMRQAIWLPRLDQWLAMLEEADIEDFRFGRTGQKHVTYWSGRHPYHWYGPTREEAAARLWVAMTKL